MVRGVWAYAFWPDIRLGNTPRTEASIFAQGLAFRNLSNSPRGIRAPRIRVSDP
jgi:hypothetical protein